MKNLFLVRHAHAADGHADHERALTTRGERAAIRAGKHLAEAHCEPQLALLSTAVRVMQTWQHIQAELPATPRVEAERSLYLADPDSMHVQLVSIPDSVECVLLVAHNPGISQLARWLTATGPSELVDRLQRGFAPGAVASLTFRVPAWADVNARSAEIRGFWD
jgi:phosphohistidine phosphatase